ncbi:MAG TPA: hypothetical protein VMV23_11360 [Candidatus Nanopelagicaceae bacterium]|nr:hypothetical protein [Candidatus Nanopelagicaceae bacterium]
MDPIEADSEPLDPARLAALTELELTELVAAMDDAERQLRRDLAPLQTRLADLAKRQAVVATERRRRERQQQLARRREIREQVKEGQAPSLRDLVEAAEPPEFGEPSLADLEFLLETGGAVALGYPGARVASLQMTDGSAVATATDLGEVRRLYGQGWEFGVPARSGVRVHTPGTRLERLLEPERCFVRAKPASGPN